MRTVAPREAISAVGGDSGGAIGGALGGAAGGSAGGEDGDGTEAPAILNWPLIDASGAFGGCTGPWLALNSSKSPSPPSSLSSSSSAGSLSSASFDALTVVSEGYSPGGGGGLGGGGGGLGEGGGGGGDGVGGGGAM